MNDYYHLFGLLNSLCYLFPCYGIYLQIKKINERKLLGFKDTTENISLNRLFASYLGCFANFILGLSFIDLNYYLSISRLAFCILTIYIFYQIYEDRKTNLSFNSLIFSILAIISFLALSYLNRELLIKLNFQIQIFAVFGLFYLVQGYITQIKVLYKTKKVGGLSKCMFQFFMLKEISSLIFATTLNLMKPGHFT